ncbi:hypothetical protein, partial [Deinococcus pimensis]|uniref:hypothetical protein n=1 Tax=Deinococcus pimensis TaxID=309888 RepID=UPI0005EB11F5
MPVPVGVTPLVLDALDAHEDGVVVFDAAWRAAYMNPAAERILRTERVLWSEREPDPPGLLGPDLWEVAREARDERRERTCEHADARLRV